MHTPTGRTTTSSPRYQNIPYRGESPATQELRASLKRLADATKQADGAFAELANTVLLPNTEQGRAAAAEIDRLTAARSIDYAAIERRVMQHATSIVLRGHARNGRRRSRQCRGSRARNYTRANARAKLGASATGGEASVYVDAVRPGAYAAALWKEVQ